MKLNRNSWFLRKYLGYDEWDLPRTVCQLGRRIVGMTVVWLVASIFVLAGTLPLLAVLGGLASVLFTDKVFSDVFNQSNPLLIFAAMYLLFAVIAGGVFGVHKIQDMRRKRYYGAYAPGPVRQFTKGIWARFKDKTCVMINYDNGVEDRLRKSKWDPIREKNQ